MESVSVIIPALDEERAVGDLVQRVRASLSDRELEVIVVDDGSTDRTAEIAEQAGARVVRHAYNKGNGASIRSGLRTAKHPICAVIDGDGQHDPNDLPRLLARLDRAEMVVGAREQVEYSAVRALGNWILNRVATYLSGQRVPDLTSGLRVFRLEALAPYASIFPNRFSFPSTSTLALLTDGYTVLFEPIRATSRSKGSSSSIRPLRDGMKFLTIIVRIVHLFHPLKLYLPIGGLVFLGGVAWSIKTIVVANQFSAGGIFLLLAGLMLTLIGFQFDQISELRRQIRRDRF